MTRDEALEKARALSEQFLKTITGHSRLETDLALALTLQTCLELSIEGMKSPAPDAVLKLRLACDTYITSALAALDRIAARSATTPERVH